MEISKDNKPSGNWLIYCITNKIDGKVYIGLTTDLTKRLAKHFSEARNGRGYRLHEAIRMYGEINFETSVLCYCASLEEALQKEIEYVSLFDSNANGYNATLGGNTSPYNTEESLESMKVKVSRALTGRTLCEQTKQKIRDSALGRRHTDESKEKMSKSRKGKALSEKNKLGISIALKGRVLTEEQKQNIREAAIAARGVPVRCIDTGVEFETILAAAQWLRSNGFPKACPSAIKRACVGVTQKAYKLRWEVVNDDDATTS